MTTTPNDRIVGAAGFHDDGTPILRISVCPRCSSRWFPTRAVCSRCAHDQLDQVDAGIDGVAYASTVVRTGPPGFAAPYALSYVDVDGVRVLAHTNVADPDNPQALPPDTPVRFTSGPTGHDGDATLFSYRVRPADSQQSVR